MAGYLPTDGLHSKIPGPVSRESDVVLRISAGRSCRRGSTPGLAKSCGEVPDNFLSFRALADRENDNDLVTSSADNANTMTNPRKIQTQRNASRASLVDISNGSQDSGTGTNDQNMPLLGGSSVTYSSLSTSQDRSQGIRMSVFASMSTHISKAVSCVHSHVAPVDRKGALSMLKVILLLCVTIVCCVMLLLQEEHEENVHFAILSNNQLEILEEGHCHEDKSFFRTTVRGPFFQHIRTSGNFTHIQIYMDGETAINLTINPDALTKEESTSKTFDLSCQPGQNYTLSAVSETRVPIDWTINKLPPATEHEVIFAFLILGFVYLLIVFEIVHRTLAAQLGALAALAVLSYLNQRPSMEVIVSWIDIETLALLFGMMIIVAIFADTGFFDYSALQAYKLAKGQVWPLITLLCVFSAVVSAFLDNVTTILLMTPVTIRLCEVLNLDPKRILMAEVLFSNIGGTATAIGDPPNVIIVGALSSEGIGFSVFTMHMFPGIVIICFVGYGVLRLYYRDMNTLKNKDPPEIAEMKHEVAMWRRAAGRLPCFTREETLMRALFLQKAVEIEHTLYKMLHKNRKNEQQSFYTTLQKLEKEYFIKDFPLLLKCGAVLLVVIILLFTYSFINTIHADIGWIAVLGSIWLLVLADIQDFEGILHKVEWATLLFFAALFILMESLSELGLMKTIGDAIADLISTADEGSRLLVALVLILWVSALASSFIDNIPYTTAMVPILQQLAEKPDLDLPLVPMVVALAMGACLGGNGTLIGASCNVVCAGIADQHGYGFTFKEFFKVGFPMMLVTTFTAMIYVLICHCAFDWNSV